MSDAPARAISRAMIAEIRASLFAPMRLLCPGCGRGFRSELADEALAEHMESCREWAEHQRRARELAFQVGIFPRSPA